MKILEEKGREKIEREELEKENIGRVLQDSFHYFREFLRSRSSTRTTCRLGPLYFPISDNWGGRAPRWGR